MPRSIPSQGAEPDEASGYLIDAGDQPRARRAADVTTVLGGLMLLGWALFAHDREDGLHQALQQFAHELPNPVVGALSGIFTAGLLFAVWALGLLMWRHRWLAVRDTVLAGLLAAGTCLFVVDRLGQLWPAIMPEFQGVAPGTDFPLLRVSLVAAVLIAAGPSLTRPLRRLGWALLLLGALAAIALAYGVPAAALGGLGIGMIAAGSVLLLLGSPAGYPDVARVSAALHGAGVDVGQLAVDPRQSWGVRRLLGTTTVGQDIVVKAYGRDATDSQVAARVYHGLLYRGGGNRPPVSRLRSVEHEAVVTMLAERSGARVPRVLAAAAGTEDVAVLVTTRAGRPLAQTRPEHLGDDVLRGIWTDLGLLHAAGISHGGLNGASVRITPDGHVIEDFSSGSLVLRDSDAALDVVHLLYAIASVVGVERAVASAVSGLGSDPVARALGYLQPPALTGRERRTIDKPRKLLADLRAEVGRVTETEIPDPVKLRRLSPRDIITILILVLFLSALLPLLTGVDWPSLWSELQQADPWLMALAVLVGQLAFVPQAVSMMFAVGRPIPLRPMTILQPAVVFISFAVPGMAGRVAMESTFLFKFGVAPAAAVTKGSIDAFSGFLVQVAVLVLALATGSLVLGPSSDASAEGGLPTVSARVLVLVFLLIAITFVAIWKVPRLHRAVVPQIRSGWDALMEVLRSPSRAVGMLGANLVVQILWGLSLWFALTALDTHLSLVTCTAVVVGTSLLQGLVPVPGGVGVSEAVIAALLAPMGVAGSTALGAAVIWRLATFYIPAVEGFVAAKYLQRRGYL